MSTLDVKNLSDTKRYLDALADKENERFTFQTFDDSKQKREELTRVLHGTLDQLASELERLNRLGAGIFVTINETDFKGRKSSNIVSIRTLCSDNDSGEVLNYKLEPSFIVDSVRGPHSYYLLVYGERLDQFIPAQALLAKALGTDPAVAKLPQVMRLPGFYHMKNPDKPVLITASIPEKVKRYTIESVLSAYGCDINSYTESTNGADPDWEPVDVGSVLEGSKDGDRNEDTFHLACKFRRNDLPLEYAIRLLRESASKCEQTKDDPFTPDMAEAIARRVYKTYYPNTVPQDTKKIKADISKFKPMDSNDILDMPDIPVPWIWDSFIASGMMFGLIASPKIGKSSFASMLAVAMAQGKPFLGLQTKKTRILILALEEHKRDVAKRIIELGFQRGDPIFVHCDDMKLNPESVEILREYIVKESIGLLIVDTLAAFWTVKNENDNAETTQALNPLKFLAHDDKLNVAIGLIHHSGKSGTTRGATAIEAILDQIITLEKPDDSDEEYTKRTLRIKGRYSESPNKLVIDLEDDEYKVLGKSERIIKAKKIEQVIKETIKLSNGLNISEIEIRTKIAERTIRKYIKILIDKRDIYEDMHGTRGKPAVYKIQPYSKDLI